jgi:hypothetical protein
MSVETLAEYASMELNNIKPERIIKIPKKSILHSLDADFKTFVQWENPQTDTQCHRMEFQVSIVNNR